jgi:hypothetical protein
MRREPQGALPRMRNGIQKAREKFGFQIFPRKAHHERQQGLNLLATHIWGHEGRNSARRRLSAS